MIEIPGSFLDNRKIVFLEGILGRNGGYKTSRPPCHHGYSHLKKLIKPPGNTKTSLRIISINHIHKIVRNNSAFLVAFSDGDLDVVTVFVLFL